MGVNPSPREMIFSSKFTGKNSLYLHIFGSLFLRSSIDFLDFSMFKSYFGNRTFPQSSTGHNFKISSFENIFLQLVHSI